MANRVLSRTFCFECLVSAENKGLLFLGRASAESKWVILSDLVSAENKWVTYLVIGRNVQVGARERRSETQVIL